MAGEYGQSPAPWKDKPRTVVGSVRYALPRPAVSAYCSALLAWGEFVSPSTDWIPAMDAQILIRRRGTAALKTRAGETIALPDHAFVGPLSGATRLVATRDYLAEGIVLRASGLQLAIGRNSAEAFVDQALDLGDVLSAELLTPLHETCQAATNHADIWSALEHLIERASEGSWQAPLRHFHVVDGWINGSVNPSVPLLSSALGLSARQAGRIVCATYGFAPKILSMRRRARVAAESLVVGDAGADPSIYDAFYDQSHLIRDIRRFIGSTPAQLARGETLAHQAISAARQAGASLI